MPYILVENSEEWKKNRWNWGGQERIRFDIANPSQFETTSQFWGSDHGWIQFNVHVQLEQIGDETTKIHIEYRRNENRHLYDEYSLEEDAIIWGTHILTIRQGVNYGSSVWRGDVGPGWKVEKISGGDTNRRRATIHAIQRGEQGVFRRYLLSLDGCCVLTGETCEVALEAAHIVPAYRGGREVVTNGMLLRADIHRLYDEIPPRFQICPESGMVLVADNFRYASFDFHRAQVDEAVRERISDALNLRHGEM